MSLPYVSLMGMWVRLYCTHIHNILDVQRVRYEIKVSYLVLLGVLRVRTRTPNARRHLWPCNNEK